MILVLFLCILLLNLILILFGSIKLKAENVKISNVSIYHYDFVIKIGLFLFNKYKVFEYVIDKNKIKGKNIYSKVKSKLLTRELFSELRQIDLFGILKELKTNIEVINLSLKLGTESVILTSILVSLISSFVCLFLSRSIKRFDIKKHFYEILPVYKNKNNFELFLNCIIDVKLVHIIYVIFRLKKRRWKNNERTSNRRSYDYSYE